MIVPRSIAPALVPAAVGKRGMRSHRHFAVGLTRPTRVMAIARGIVLASGALAISACTLTHSLDEYHSGTSGVEAADGAVDAGIPDPPVPLSDGGDGGAGGDGGDASPDGCEGTPVITSPTDGAMVSGATVRVTVTVPTCLKTMILYVDSTDNSHYKTAIDVEIPLAVGTHKINVNGWAGTDLAHTSKHVSVTRTK